MSKGKNSNSLKYTHYLFLSTVSFLIISSLLFTGVGIHKGSDRQDTRKVELYQKDVAAMSDDKNDAREPEENEDQAPNEIEEEKKKSVTTLTFNFIYYVIYKFKMADLL